MQPTQMNSTTSNQLAVSFELSKNSWKLALHDGFREKASIRQADDSLLYRHPGSLNGNDGIYEIAVNPQTGTIFHRTFVGN